MASPVAQEALGPPLLEPQIVLANNGVASLTLEAAPSRITVHDRPFTSNVYNGQHAPGLPVAARRRASTTADQQDWSGRRAD